MVNIREEALRYLDFDSLNIKVMVGLFFVSRTIFIRSCFA